MTEQHRATPKQWLTISLDGRTNNVAAASTILELRDRIEALEVAAKPNHPAKPDSSLVDQVEDAIHRNWNESGHGFRAEARAAIRAVAVWMTSNPDHHFPPALVFALDREAER